MALHKASLDELKAQLADIGERFTALKDHELFIVWFLRAYITENEEAAVDALTGSAWDQGADAVFIDDAAKAVFIVQGKYRHRLHGGTESRSDVQSFAELGVALADSDNDIFNERTRKASADSLELIKKARVKVRQQGYRLWMFYVTLARCSTELRHQAKQMIRKAQCQAELEVIDGKRVLVILRDYLDGVAPPIPSLELVLENNADVRNNGILQRYDTQNDVEAWAFTMRGDAIAQLYDQSGRRIFARNIRGYLGAGTSVNRAMIATLKDEADLFFYFNNGVTILCDKAEKLSRKGRDILRVENPQIINGQQTTRTLAERPELAKRASVLVKVMQVSRDPGSPQDRFDGLLSKIVAGTNWQNAISAADLMSNDRIQVELERNLRKLKYLYVRKRQRKGEARQSLGAKGYHVLSKLELAQAVAGCELDPSIVREGKNNLFEEDYYSRVFPNSDPSYYLPRYWLFRNVTFWARGKPQRGYAKWTVIGYLWSDLQSRLRSSRKAKAICLMHEQRYWDDVRPLDRATEGAFRAVLQYYKEQRGKGEKAKDISTFFQLRGHDKGFAIYLKRKGTKHVRAIKKHLKRFDSKLDAFDA